MLHKKKKKKENEGTTNSLPVIMALIPPANGYELC